MVVLQFFLTMIYMLFIPYLVGVLCMPRYARYSSDKLIWTMTTGLLVTYSIYEILAMGFVLTKQSFRLLTAIFAVVVCFMAFLGVVKVFLQRSTLSQLGGLGAGFSKEAMTYPKKRGVEKEASDLPKDKVHLYKQIDGWMLLGMLLIMIQIAAILIWATPDKDDAFYSGLSSVCLSLDRVLQIDAYYGLLEYGVSARYAVSALPAYQASLSLLSSGMHHLIITHNLFPLFYMPLAYALLYSIGKELLRAEQVEMAKGKLLFAIALLHMIGNYFVFSPENFLVTRIWQGKALFIVIGVPYLWHMGRLALEGMSGDKRAVFIRWFMVAVGLLAITFMGETGLYLGPFMLLGMCLVHTIMTKKYKHFIPAILCLLPDVGLLVILLMR